MKKERVNFGAGVNYDYCGYITRTAFNNMPIKLTLTLRIHEKRTLRGRYYKVFTHGPYDGEMRGVYPQHKYRTFAAALDFGLNCLHAKKYTFDLNEVPM